MSAGGITAEPPVAAAPLPSGEPGRLGRYLVGALFLAPALLMLGVWMVYPAVYTIIRSFFGQTGFIGTWVGIDNYKTLFTTHTLLTAIKNNAIWVAVVLAFVTALGLIFAVLTERVRWAVVRFRPNRPGSVEGGGAATTGGSAVIPPALMLASGAKPAPSALCEPRQAYAHRAICPSCTPLLRLLRASSGFR